MAEATGDVSDQQGSESASRDPQSPPGLASDPPNLWSHPGFSIRVRTPSGSRMLFQGAASHLKKR